ncbi:MAG: hypothetical protein U0T82_13760 [Bacteroidales bacterium]
MVQTFSSVPCFNKTNPSLYLCPMRNFNRILSSLFFLALFLAPTLARMDHHHHHKECNAKALKHWHEGEKSCAICDFEFSIFEADDPATLPHALVLTAALVCPAPENQPVLCPAYFFLLRAPPMKTA